MRRFALTLVALAATLLALLTPASASPVGDGPTGIEVDGDTIKRVDPQSGKQQWQIVHASTWVTVSRDKRDTDIVDPIMADGHLYYGVYNWLMEVDPEHGVIEHRRMFPDKITAVERYGDSGLKVSVEVENDFGDAPHQVDFRYELGTPTSQEIWNLIGLMDNWKDASYLSKAINTDYVGGAPKDDDGNEVEGYPATDKERRSAIEKLRARRAQEPTNPFFDYFIGATYQEMGKDDLATEAYRRAATTENGHWTSYLQLAAFLDGAKRHDLADKAFDRAQTQIENMPNVPVRYWTSLPGYILTLGWSKFAVHEAVEGQEHRRAHRILERTAETFPHLAHSPKAWRTLSRWYADAGKKDLAATWTQHAKRADQSAWRSIFNAHKTVDVTVALIIGFTLSFWLACFVIGARRSDGEHWLPRPTRAELAGLTIAFVIPLGLLWIQGTATQKIRFIADRADEVAISGWSSPNAQKWAKQLHESNARRTLLHRIDKLSSATRNGDPGKVDFPPPALVVSAIDADSSAEAWNNLFYDGETYLMKQFDSPPLLVDLAIFLAVGLLTLFIGGLIGRISILQTALRYIIPGGARSASFLTPILLGLLITALVSLTLGFDNLLHRIASPSFGKYFGLGPLYDQTHESKSNLHWWLTLAAVALAHAATVYLDYAHAPGHPND